MNEERLHRRGVGAVWLATFIWAWGPVLVKWSDLSGPTFAMYRLGVGVGVSAIAVGGKRRRSRSAGVRPGGARGADRRRPPEAALSAGDVGVGAPAMGARAVADEALIGALAPVAIVLV